LIHATTYNVPIKGDWAALAASLKSAGFPRVRILGNDCDAFNVATNAFKNQGIQVLAGIYAGSGTIAASKVGQDPNCI